MKILHVVDCLGTGGTERQLVELVRRQVEARLNVSVAVLQKKGPNLDVLRGLGLEPEEFQTGPSLASVWTMVGMLALSSRIRKIGYQVVHTHDFYSGVMGVPAAILAGVPSIQSRRDMCHWLDNRQRYLLKLVGRMASAVVANSGAAMALAKAEDGVAASKAVVIHNGLDLEKFDREGAGEVDEPLPCSASGDVGRVALVGNMVNPVKGQDLFLQAASRVLADNRETQFLLVGEGPLQDRYEALARELGIDRHVHFLGTRKDVAAILRSVEVAVLASDAEGLPNVVMEAMAAGKPVVSTKVGGAVELVRDGVNGYLVPPREPQIMADRVSMLLNDREKAEEMGRKGREIIEEAFCAVRMAHRVHSLYGAMCDSHGKGVGLSLEERMRLRMVRGQGSGVS